jgi:Tfp pilus assembly protein PilN
LRKAGAHRVPVTVLLPRRDVIVRQLALPGVSDKDLPAAVAFQIDSLHPYPEDSVAHAWVRLPRTSTVLVAIVQRELIDRWTNLFTEAGVKMAAFTFSAAALFSASRILTEPPSSFAAFGPSGMDFEAYGESSARGIFSGVFDAEAGARAERLTRSELRLSDDAESLSLADLLPPLRNTPTGYPVEDNAQLLAAAVTGACPRLSIQANLLPEHLRSQTSRLIYIPTAILGVLLIGAAIVAASQQPVEDRRYLDKLNQEIKMLERQAAQVGQIDKSVQDMQARMALLDRHRRRSQADAEALREMTNLLQPPAWLAMFALTRSDITVNGEAEQAAPLLRVIDQSPLFRDSGFSQAMSKVGAGAETFVLRTIREGEGVGLEQGEQR